MAIEAANAAGGVEGRPLRLMARDTRSHGGDDVAQPAGELFAAGAPVLIGPDQIDLVTQLRAPSLDQEHTLLLPSFNTASDVGFGYKPASWFVMGPGSGRMACELVSQLHADGRRSALVVTNAKGYNSAIAWNLANLYGMPKYILPAMEPSATATVKSILAVKADAYVLAAFPADASSLFYAMAAIGNLDDPTRWYLSPTLHTPAFLDTLPTGVLAGARGVSPGTVAGAGDFRDAFARRWQDRPLDDAYPFYDAGAVAALAIERAFVRTGTIPSGTGLAEHIQAVTRVGNEIVDWNELEQGLALLRRGQEIEYVGLSGILEFDSTGQAPTANTKWWTVGTEAFLDKAASGECK
jgi:ABC-type branched-subunit amino acid transport system substrate-binding protein